MDKKDIQSKFKKLFLAGATIATMATPVNAAEKKNSGQVSESTKTENVFSYSNQNIQEKFTLLKHILSDYSKLSYKELYEVADWKNYIVNNPEDSISREAFKEIKKAALSITNIYIKVDHYYETGYLSQANMSYDQLKNCQTFFQMTMDELLHCDEVKKHIPEANVINHVSNESAENLASLRFYEQLKTFTVLQEKPQKLDEYIKNRSSKNKKQRHNAFYTKMAFYKNYGVDLDDCVAGTNAGICNEYDLFNKKTKEKVYMYFLHIALDAAFDYEPNNLNQANIDGEIYSIPFIVATTFKDYAGAVVKKMRGKKLSKQDNFLIDNAPTDIRSSTDAYFNRYFKQYCALMDKPKDENIVAFDTRGCSYIIWEKYINLQRLDQKTPDDIYKINALQEFNPLLAEADKYYKYQKQAEKEKQQILPMLNNINTR